MCRGNSVPRTGIRFRRGLSTAYGPADEPWVTYYRPHTNIECPRVDGIGLLNIHVFLKIFQSREVGPWPWNGGAEWRWCSADWSEIFPGHSITPYTQKPVWMNVGDEGLYNLCAPHAPSGDSCVPL